MNKTLSELTQLFFGIETVLDDLHAAAKSDLVFSLDKSKCAVDQILEVTTFCFSTLTQIARKHISTEQRAIMHGVRAIMSFLEVYVSALIRHMADQADTPRPFEFVVNLNQVTKNDYDSVLVANREAIKAVLMDITRRFPYQEKVELPK